MNPYASNRRRHHHHQQQQKQDQHQQNRQQQPQEDQAPLHHAAVSPMDNAGISGVGAGQYSQQQQQHLRQPQIPPHPAADAPGTAVNDGNHNNDIGNNNQHHQQQQQQPNILAVEQVQQLQSQLAQQEETNFDLNVEIATLQAELKNSEKTLKEKSVQEKSKWEHDLRLAQQEAQKWKLKYQKQQQQHQQAFTNTTTDTVGGLDVGVGSLPPPPPPKEVEGNHPYPQHHRQQPHPLHHDENNVNQQQHHQQQRFAPPPQQQLQSQLHHQPVQHPSESTGAVGTLPTANDAVDNDMDMHVEFDHGMVRGRGRGRDDGGIMTMKKSSNDDDNNNFDDVTKNVPGTNDMNKNKKEVQNKVDRLNAEAAAVAKNWKGTIGTNTSTSTTVSPVRRLVIELLSQVPEEEEDEQEEVQHENHAHNDMIADGSGKKQKQQQRRQLISSSTSTSTYVSTNYRMIRRVLMNIAFDGSDENDTTKEELFDGGGSGSECVGASDIHKTMLLPNHQPKLPSPQEEQAWTESSLVEWLVGQSLICMKNSRATTTNNNRDNNNHNGGDTLLSTAASTLSSSSSLVDVYVHTALLQSPDARRNILQKILKKTNSSLLQEGKPPSIHSGGGSGSRRRRKVRIHPITDDVSNSTVDDSHQQRLTVDDYERMRRSLLNPWCDLTKVKVVSHQSGCRKINDHNDEDAEMTSTSDKTIREWTHNLASSWSPMHLQILQILVEEQSSMGLSNDIWWEEDCFDTTTNQTRMNVGIYPSGSCISSILTTIQTLVCRRLHQQRFASANDSTPKTVGTSSGTNSGPGSRTTTHQVNEKNPSHSTTGMKRGDLPYRFQLSSIAPTSYHKSNPHIKKSDTKYHRKIDPLLAIFHPSDDETLAMALSVLNVMISVSSFRKREQWYRSRVGLHIIDEDEDEGIEVGDKVDNPNEGDVIMGGTESDLKQNTTTTAAKTIPGGVFVVSILLEMMEGLQFLEWTKDENPLASKNIYSVGTNINIEPNDLVLPTWYYHIIPLFMTIGRTYAGMKVLRTRLPDFKNYDWMGNALDVSIRNLHVLVQFWDSVDLVQPHSILRLEPIDHESPYAALDQTRARNQVGRVIEMWVRFWHQVLLYVAKTDDKGGDSQLSGQPNPNTTQNDRDEACGVTFRYLFIDVQDWLTGAYTVLMNSADTRQEIKSMIYQQLQELSLDEEERDDSKE